MITNDLIGPFAAQQAQSMKGSINAAVAAAGSSLATGTVITAAVSAVTSGSGGVTLPTWASTGDLFTIYNLSGSAVNVYPPSATAKMNAGTLGAAVSLSNAKMGSFRLLDNGVTWGASYS